MLLSIFIVIMCVCSLSLSLKSLSLSAHFVSPFCVAIRRHFQLNQLFCIYHCVYLVFVVFERKKNKDVCVCVCWQTHHESNTWLNKRKTKRLVKTKCRRKKMMFIDFQFVWICCVFVCVFSFDTSSTEINLLFFFLSCFFFVFRRCNLFAAQQQQQLPISTSNGRRYGASISFTLL